METAIAASEGVKNLEGQLKALENNFNIEAQRTSMRFIHHEAAHEAALQVDKVKVVLDLDSSDKQLVEALVECPDAAIMISSLKLSSPACATKVECQGQ